MSCCFFRFLSVIKKCDLDLILQSVIKIIQSVCHIILRKYAGTGIHTEISGKNNRSHIFNKVNDLFLIWKTFSVLSQKSSSLAVSICQLLHSLQNCFLLICHNRHFCHRSCCITFNNSNPEGTQPHFVIILLQQNQFVNKKRIDLSVDSLYNKNSSGYTSELFLILIWRCTQEAEGTALEMRQAGQPVRGFKSLHLRSFFVKFFIIKMHNKLDNCMLLYV